MEPDEDEEEEQEDMELEEEGEEEEVVTEVEVEVGIPQGVNKAGQLGKILQLLYLLGLSHNQLGRK